MTEHVLKETIIADWGEEDHLGSAYLRCNGAEYTPVSFNVDQEEWAEGWYSFDCPTCGERLRFPNHYGMRDWLWSGGSLVPPGQREEND